MGMSKTLSLTQGELELLLAIVNSGNVTVPFSAVEIAASLKSKVHRLLLAQHEKEETMPLIPVLVETRITQRFDDQPDAVLGNAVTPLDHLPTVPELQEILGNQAKDVVKQYEQTDPPK